MIVKMKKASLYGAAQEKSGILAELAALGCVDVTDRSDLLQEEELCGFLRKDAPGAELAGLEAEAASVRTAIAGLLPYDKAKKPLFQQKPRLTPDALQAAFDSRSAARDSAAEVNRLLEEHASLQSRLNTEKLLTQSLRPWLAYDIPLRRKRTKYVCLILGTVDAATDVSAMAAALAEEYAESFVRVLNADKQQQYLLWYVYSAYEYDFLKESKQFGFTPVTFKDLTGTPAEELRAAEERISQAETEVAALEEALAEQVASLPALRTLADALDAQIERQRLANRLVRTESVFYLEGFVPEPAVGQLTEKMERFCCAVEFSDVEETDDVPVLLSNPSVIQPYESVTAMYAQPVYGGFDPNKVMAPFFWLFFGMMLGDAVYGILLVLICGFIMWKSKFRPTEGRLIKLMFQCGFSTALAGFLFGSIAGDLGPQVYRTITGVTVSNWALIDPLKDPITMLLLCLGLGVVHLFTGMGVKLVLLLKQKQWKQAFNEVICWWCVIGGLLMLVLGGVAGKIGMWTAIFGAAGILVTTGDSKNPIVRIGAGLYGLYGITSYLGDILSYSRLFALGLATSVISSVVNTMATLLGFSPIGIILFVVLVLGGHALNLAINILGAYVHASRLQYVEFFGKFYESGGRPFDPFALHTQYTDIRI